MSHFESTVEIERPEDSVYAWFLAMDENAPRIDPEADEGHKELPGETRPGTTFYLKSGSRELPVDLYESRAEPMDRLRYETRADAPYRQIVVRTHRLGHSTEHPCAIQSPDLAEAARASSEWDGGLDRIRADLEGSD